MSEMDASKIFATLDRQRAVIDVLYTMTLMPRPAGNAPAPLDSVRMEAKS